VNGGLCGVVLIHVVHPAVAVLAQTLHVHAADAAVRGGDDSRGIGQVHVRFANASVHLHVVIALRTAAQVHVHLADAEAIISTNLLGPIRLTAALLPLLQRQPCSTILNVSSGLAFVPLALTPTYCATKAAIHSYTQSLRFQLRSTQVEVLELIPPYVATHLMCGGSDPRAMPLNEFIAEVITILKTQPTPAEICVERVKGLRLAAERCRYDATFEMLNSPADAH